MKGSAMTETVEHVDYVDYDSYAARMMAWPVLLKQVAKWPAILCPPVAILVLAMLLTQQTMIDCINNALSSARFEIARGNYGYSDSPVIIRSDPEFFSWLSGPWTSEASLSTSTIVMCFVTNLLGVIAVVAVLWAIAAVIGKSFDKELGGFLKLEGLGCIAGLSFFLFWMLTMIGDVMLPDVFTR